MDDETDGGEEVVGVAIAIPQPHANVLANWRCEVGDPAGELVFPHVTLLPPTPIPSDAMAEVEKHLDETAALHEPFTMHLSGTGTFRPTSQVVYIQVAAGVSNCEVLEREIRSGPLARELQFPYHPHVTVAQDIPDDRLDDAYDGLSGFIARFRVETFVLFSRDASGRWNWHREFALGGTAAGPDE
ncbi:MAG TPA: 2'-5' RNA ligase family protein [Jatrophihabitans sp.]|nr:2'-5' RNA ligase family protein [Jatrophihabitans sp.]